MKNYPENMNGEYIIANPDPNSEKPYSTDFMSKDVEFFDIISPPIITSYGEVNWQTLEDVYLPSELIQRFDGKIMSLVGWE